MRLQHKLKFLKVIGKNPETGKPVHLALCSCGKQYTGMMKTFRHFTCTNTEKSPHMKLYQRYTKSAEVRGYKMELSLEEFSLLTGFPCAYCGALPSMEIDGVKFSGLDRVDNTKNYNKDNAIMCCSSCNKMKGTLTSDEFVDKIKKINEYYVSDFEMIREYEKTSS